MHRLQRQWGWPSAVQMFCSGAAAGAYLILVIPYLLAGGEVYSAGILASAILVLISVGLLLADMTSVWLAPRAFSNLRSPQALGGMGLTLFVILSVVSAGIAYTGAAADALPVVAWLGGLAALATLVYPGMVMGSMKAIPFWSGATPALLMPSTALLSGAAVVTVMGGVGEASLSLRTLTLWLLVVYGVILLMHVVMGSQGLRAGRISVQQLTRGRLSLMFWLGVVLVGVVAPLALYIVDLWAPSAAMLQIASLLIIVGGLLVRYCLLASGIKTPVLRDDAITATYWLSH